MEDLSIADASLKVISLRYFNPVDAYASDLLGEDPQRILNNLMPFLARVANGELTELSVFGSDYSTVDVTGDCGYIHAVDLADGYVAALQHLPKAQEYEVFNLGSSVG